MNKKGKKIAGDCFDNAIHDPICFKPIEKDQDVYNPNGMYYIYCNKNSCKGGNMY